MTVDRPWTNRGTTSKSRGTTSKSRGTTSKSRGQGGLQIHLNLYPPKKYTFFPGDPYFVDVLPNGQLE